jgi:NifU-like protein involved in Fe-S cluster formation
MDTDPLHIPLQVTFVIEDVRFNAAGCPLFAIALEVQPFLSVTVAK